MSSRYSGLAAGIAAVADSLRKEREMGAETGQKINLLGISGLMEGKIAPAQAGETGTTFDLPMGKFKPARLQTIPEGYEISGYNVNGMPIVKKIKEESYSQRKQDSIQAASSRIQKGETDFETEKKNLLSVFPDISWDTLENLREIGKIYKPEIVKRQQGNLPKKSPTNILESIGNIATLPFKLPFKNQPQGEISSRNRAIQELQNIGYPITENNIKSAMQQLQGK